MSKGYYLIIIRVNRVILNVKRVSILYMLYNIISYVDVLNSIAMVLAQNNKNDTKYITSIIIKVRSYKIYY